jgi:hypothetical protein
MNISKKDKQFYIEKGITHIIHIVDISDNLEYDVLVKTNENYYDVLKKLQETNMMEVKKTTWIIDKAFYDETVSKRTENTIKEKVSELFQAKEEELTKKIQQLPEKTAKQLLEFIIKSKSSL